MAHPSNEVRNLRRRVGRARRFPSNTCAASRHAEVIAEGLLRGDYAMLKDEPEHCAISLLATVEALWRARTELQEVRDKLERRGRSR